jgi:hypothetical protein
MGFRDYHPGLNRFLTRDMFNGALVDLNLGLNPWTGNRYAFAGGNPITGIEHDGHCPIDACGAGTPIGGGRIAQTGPIDPGNPSAGYLRDGAAAAGMLLGGGGKDGSGGVVAGTCTVRRPACRSFNLSAAPTVAGVYVIRFTKGQVYVGASATNLGYSAVISEYRP